MTMNGHIQRVPDEAQHRRYDLIIIGGGIYGAMLALESARRGLKPLLLERGDFGGETSFNSLRIVHGGLRYLQKLDLPRFNESVRERKWFLKTFPELVKPLPCLMPLYGKGMHRRSILSFALKLNDLLSSDRNTGVPESNHLAPGSVIGVEETRRLFPAVSSSGLTGAAKWHDAMMINSQRVLIEILKWACRLGATAINYMEADQLVTDGAVVNGVSATDGIGGGAFRFEAPVVFNAAGPWCRKLAEKYHIDIPSLFRPSIAVNLLLDRPSLSDHALAINPHKNEGHTYFLVPWHGKIFAGTGHYPLNEEKATSGRPSEKQLSAFLADLNCAVPQLKLKLSDIIHMHNGLLPVKQNKGTQLTVREIITNHGEKGGPEGLYTVSGIKFTTSRLVAQKSLKMAFKDLGEYTPDGLMPPNVHNNEALFDIVLSEGSVGKNVDAIKPILRRIIEKEAVQHLDDLLYRRTSLYENPDALLSLTKDICQLIEPNCFSLEDEFERLKKRLASNYPRSYQ